MLARTVLEWVDNKQLEAYKTNSTCKSINKAFVSGVVEGVVDGCLIVGGIVLAVGYIGMTIGKTRK